MKHETKITVSDGIATFEDGTQIRATVEQLAAAPELLEVMKGFADAGQMVIDRWECGDLADAVTHMDEWITAARAVIAKAEGRES